MKKPKKKILRFILLSLGALAVIGAAAVVSALPEAIEVLRYPDARAGGGAAPVPSTHAFNVTRERNPLSGVNFGLALQAPQEGDWGVVIDESDFDAAMRAGFGHIRVHVRFLPYLSKGDGAYRIDPGLLKRLDWVIGKILDRGMIAIIDLYLIIPDDKLSFSSRRDAESIEERFLAVWGILAEHYRDFPPGLYFELANEPHRPLDSEVWNDYARKAIGLIRGSGGSNATRMVVVGTCVRIARILHVWDQVKGIEDLDLPSAEEDPNIMVTFHYYDPYSFTHQGQTYTREMAMVSWVFMGNTWTDSDAQIAYVRRDFDMIARWARENGRRVILGEFGASVYADLGSQARWTARVRKEAEARGMVWIFWDFYSKDRLGALYDQAAGAWRAEILDALMPALEGDAARSAAFIAESAEALGDSEWRVRMKAATSLKLGGPAAAAAIPELTTALGDEEWQVRRMAALALANFGSPANPAMPALTKALDDEEWQVREAAIQALGAIGPASLPSQPALIVFLADAEWRVRKAAVEALTSIDPGDAAALKAIKPLLDDPESQVRDAAKLAMRKLKK